MQVLESSPWDWMLLRDEGKLFFTVLCGSVAMYSVDIQLSESEVTEYDNRNRGFGVIGHEDPNESRKL